MSALPLTITHAGLQRFTTAQLDDEIDLTITTVGLTPAAFVVAPTLTALPGEARRVATVSGEAVGNNIVHMTVRDDAELTYTVRGFGLFLADGTLFAVYGGADPIVEKASVSALYLAIDIAFPTAAIDHLTFGNTNFLNPPATETRAGVAEIATAAEVAAGVDTTRFVTPARLRAMLAALIPIGSIITWYEGAGPIPGGWAACNGQTVPRSDGAGNITLPDWRGRAIVGDSAEHPAGSVFGMASVVVDTTDAGAHAHTIDIVGGAGAAQTGVTATTTRNNQLDGGGNAGALDTVTLNDPGHSHDVTGGTGAAGAHHHAVSVDVIPPSRGAYIIMKV